MNFKNNENHFGVIAISLHWIMAVLIIGMLAVGLYMINLPASDFKFELYGLHKATGVAVLTLAIIRLFWRLSNITPRLNLPSWEVISSRLAHWGLYGFMLAMPLTGWLLSSAADKPISFYGLFKVPMLIAPNKELTSFFRDAHHWLGYALIAILVLHTLAALKHHFYDKDDILRRMISSR